MADFAEATGGGQIKTGSLSRSEIEREHGSMATYESPFKSFEHTGESVEGA